VAKKPAGAKGDASWPQLVQSLAVTGAARELARNAELKRREGSLFELVVPKAKAFLVDRAHQEKLKAALEQHLGCAVTVKVSVGEVGGASAAAIEAGERDAARAAAAQAVQKDGFVNDLVNLLDGKVVGSSIRQEGK
jgi:DNA polymerase-3 subunit gamma/tau